MRKRAERNAIEAIASTRQCVLSAILREVIASTFQCGLITILRGTCTQRHGRHACKYVRLSCYASYHVVGWSTTPHLLQRGIYESEKVRKVRKRAKRAVGPFTSVCDLHAVDCCGQSSHFFCCLQQLLYCYVQFIICGNIPVDGPLAVCSSCCTVMFNS